MAKAAKAKNAKKTTAKKKGSARKRLTPRREKRGPAGADVLLDVEGPALRDLSARVRAVGGTPVGAHREPFSGKPLLLAVLPFSPYLRNDVVARINPVRFYRAKKGESEPPMTVAAALTRMAAAKKFDTSTVREQELALVAAMSAD